MIQSLCNQLSQFSVDLYQTLCTCCGHGFLNLVFLGSFLGDRVKSLYNQLFLFYYSIFFKLCILVVDKIKMFMCIFD